MLPDGFQLMLADFTRGLPAPVVDWFLHSNDPRAVENRRIVKARYAAEMYMAGKRQRKIHQNMKAMCPDQRSDVRFVACIDPVIAQDFRNRYGSACLNDRQFLEHCRRTAPELFYYK
jgi:hypothetical protein